MADESPLPTDLPVPEPQSTPEKSDVRASEWSFPIPARTPIPKKNPSPSSVLGRYVSTTDQSLLRLRRLLTTAAGLETFLSTINYALYILAYLETRLPPRWPLLQQLSKLAGHQSRKTQDLASPVQPSQSPSQSAAPLATLRSLISDTRITLRLTALLPLYTWLRELLADHSEQDRYLSVFSLIQCISYIIYQFTENVAFLADQGILPRKWLEKRGGSAKWWLWSSRAWLAGVSCDFLRLFRQALIERDRRSAMRRSGEGKTEGEMEKQQSIDRAWWSEMFVASCWFPLCLHYSLENGLKGVNTGVVGLLGFMAGAQSFTAQWAKADSM